MAVSFFMPFKSTDGRAVVQNRYSRAGRGSFTAKPLSAPFGAGADERCPVGKLSVQGSFSLRHLLFLLERAHIRRCRGSVILL